ncbi:hypothetical protein [Kitasatospora sp. NPDC057198]|uniref:hypothetical protein n=1 Tax=Kitasatospora sp. NPDC057198 TaxID=3346046 RepID=UPI003632EA1B
MSKSGMREFGDTASGVVVDEHDWGGYNPRMVKPRRRVVGTVHRIFPAAPNVVGVRTTAGDEFVIRTDLH